MGDRYGPRLVGRTPATRADVRGKRIAIPGPLTSAYLALRLYEPDFLPVPTPFDEIEDRVADGEVDLGLATGRGLEVDFKRTRQRRPHLTQEVVHGRLAAVVAELANLAQQSSTGEFGPGRHAFAQMRLEGDRPRWTAVPAACT